MGTTPQSVTLNPFGHGASLSTPESCSLTSEGPARVTFQVTWLLFGQRQFFVEEGGCQPRLPTLLAVGAGWGKGGGGSGGSIKISTRSCPKQCISSVHLCRLLKGLTGQDRAAHLWVGAGPAPLGALSVGRGLRGATGRG